jgi:hypothetical protein
VSRKEQAVSLTARRWRLAVTSAALLLASCGDGAAQPPPAGLTPGPSPLIDPDEIVSGGPPPDGIPPIDDPRFVDPSRVDWLSAREPVLSLELNGDARAYPAQILLWHEIVNDQVGGVPVTVTYCPLCNTGIAFRRPVVDGQLLDFGTSGKLYRSNLVMYDRQTESYWAQATGQAIMGSLTGMRLEFIAVQIVAWEDWVAAYPSGKVLSLDTGHRRAYGRNPYEGYDRADSSPFLFSGEPDPRLPPKARIVGVRVGDDVVAFTYEELMDRAMGPWSVISATVGGRLVVVFWKEGTVSAVDQADIALSRSVGATGAFDPDLDGRPLTFTATQGGIVDVETGTSWDIFGRAIGGPLEGAQLDRIISIESFWFDWAAFHPDTRIFGS